jgi:hypothetical protein
VSSIATRPIARTGAVAAVVALAVMATLLALALSRGGVDATTVHGPAAQPQYIGAHGEYRAPQADSLAPNTVEPLGQRPGARP